MTTLSLIARASAIAAGILALACGPAVTVDDSPPRDAGAPDTASSEIDAPDETDADAASEPCSAYTPGYDAVPSGGHVGGGALGCQVAVGVTTASGSPSLVLRTGTLGTASLAGGTLRLTCSDDASVLMRAAIGCFQGPGRYVVRAGALVLGGASSDRPCTVDVDTTEGEVRGFLECSTSPADPTNVFANSGPPVGLGSYTLTYP